MHFSVMAAESLELLAVRPDGIYLDATTGLGGHTALIAARLERGFVIANDRDAQSLEMARQNTLELAERIRFRHATFGMLAETVRSEGFEKVDGLLADLGVSRYQLTAPERGFSFLMDGPLDMRMDPTQGMTAADLVNYNAEKALADLIYQMGEERGGAEGSQSNRPRTAHTEHTASSQCSGAGRAPDGPSASGHEDIHGPADGGERRAWRVGPVAGDGAGDFAGRRADGRDQLHEHRRPQSESAIPGTGARRACQASHQTSAGAGRLGNGGERGLAQRQAARHRNH